ncbi:MAG: ArdC family protein [Planctomycetota bacterium]
MKFYGRSEEAATRILDAFRTGNLPAALAPLFIRRADNVPCRLWSWSNQLLTALAGTSDARGFRQWLDAGRAVRKGAHAFHILGPIIVKREERDAETGEPRERMALVGFKSIPVFRLEDTEVVDETAWAAASEPDREQERFIDGLPLVSVARAWGLSVETYSGTDGAPLGRYSSNARAIALGVRNLATWAHELTHAADDRCIDGGLKPGQRADQEIVAELGGAVLLECLGFPDDADVGGAWRYIEAYARRDSVAPLTYCERLLKRVCEAVALILDTAAELSAAEPTSAAA